MLKGVSPIISTVLLILIAISIAAFVGPWSLNLATTTSNASATNAMNQIDCQNTFYDFSSDYGNYEGVNITASGGLIIEFRTKLENTGTRNVYGFSFQLSNSTDIFNCAVTSATQKSSSDPLRPGEECIIEALLSGECANMGEGSITKVKVLNGVCSKNSPSLDI
ncbi:MAG: type IV pilin [Candidatus Aenigmarchaeota archaeon]|nr:type IV pilin [Candidatus Aenigmarchaeota archaeon]